MQVTKKCGKCGKEGPLSDFHKDRTKPDGLHANCKSCKHEAHMAWKRLNRDKTRAAEKRRREKYKQKCSDAVKRSVAKNPEKYRQYRNEWARENREKRRLVDRKYREANKEKVSAVRAARRARVVSQTIPLTQIQKDQIMLIYKKAKAISELTGIPHQVDHIFPLKGKNSCGLHVPWNLQILTASQNASKGNKEPINGRPAWQVAEERRKAAEARNAPGA